MATKHSYKPEDLLGTDAKAIARRLKVLKVLTGLSNREFARKARVTPQRLAYYIQGRHRPTRIEVLVGLAEAGGVSLDALMTGEGFLEFLTKGGEE